MEPAHIKLYLQKDDFLEFATCAGECTQTIRAINLASPKANIYYCDEANKGFHTPDNDLTKAGMECGLILCSHCHAIRQARYDQEQVSKGTATGRTRRRCTKID